VKPPSNTERRENDASQETDRTLSKAFRFRGPCLERATLQQLQCKYFDTRESCKQVHARGALGTVQAGEHRQALTIGRISPKFPRYQGPFISAIVDLERRGEL